MSVSIGQRVSGTGIINGKHVSVIGKLTDLTSKGTMVLIPSGKSVLCPLATVRPCIQEGTPVTQGATARRRVRR